MRLNILWLLMIVILPFPTEIVAGYDSDRFTGRSLRRQDPCPGGLRSRCALLRPTLLLLSPIVLRVWDRWVS
jgi:hypothetical protein